MNRVILVGRLTRDPIVNYSQGDKPMAIARFTLAVDRRVAKSDNSNQQTADFISCVAYDKQGEFAEKYLKQGIKVVLEGHIRTGSYLNKEGQRIYTTDVVADAIEFAESKAASANANQKPQDQQKGYTTDEDGFMSIPDGVEDEGLPFM